MDKSCVISNASTDEKKSISSERVRPEVSFLGPTHTLSAEKFQTACGGFVIMSHFMELNYFTRAEKYAILTGVIESILRTVVQYLPVGLQQPDNYEARANLLWAASRELNSFCGSGHRQGASCHAMEHELSACYDLTYGLGLAILYPGWMKYLLKKDPSVAEDFARFGVEVMGCPVQEDPQKGAQKVIEALESFLFETLELKSTLKECGIDDSRFAEMAENACKGDEVHGYRTLSPADVEDIYRMCL